MTRSSISLGHVDHTLTVTAGEVKSYILPRSLRHEDNHLKQNKGIHITSTDKIRIIGENQETHSTDLFLVYPVTSLGNKDEESEYYPVCWDQGRDSRVLLAALYENTVIKVTPTDSIQYNGVTYSKGHTFDVVLQLKYSTLQFGSKSTVGFTGDY